MSSRQKITSTYSTIEHQTAGHRHAPAICDKAIDDLIEVFQHVELESEFPDQETNSFNPIGAS